MQECTEMLWPVASVILVRGFFFALIWWTRWSPWTLARGLGWTDYWKCMLVGLAISCVASSAGFWKICAWTRRLWQWIVVHRFYLFISPSFMGTVVFVPFGGACVVCCLLHYSVQVFCNYNIFLFNSIRDLLTDHAWTSIGCRGKKNFESIFLHLESAFLYFERHVCLQVYFILCHNACFKLHWKVQQRKKR